VISRFGEISGDFTLKEDSELGALWKTLSTFTAHR